MKKIIFLIFIILFLDYIKPVSISFFRPRDITTDSTFELSLSNYYRYHTQNNNIISFFAKPFFIYSENSKDLAKYFLVSNKVQASLEENGEGDIDPLWINLISSGGTYYSSNLSIRPKRSCAGVILTSYFKLSNQFWLGINTTAMQVKTNEHLNEINRSQLGIIPNFRTAYDAFNNSDWNAGKISNENQHKGGLDDIQLKLGYDFFKNNSNHATFYFVGTIPTGNKPKSVHLFEPLIGSNHVSFGIGFDGDIQLYTKDHNKLSWMIDLKYRFVFSANEKRSFDLTRNGDWSRYLLVVSPDHSLNSKPAINLLTIPVKVTPQSTIDLWTAVHYRLRNWNFEFGYEFWWRQKEKISKKNNIESGFGIQTLALDSLPHLTASTANISQSASGSNSVQSDSQFVFITNNDLNNASASHPSANSQKLYLSLGHTFESNQCSGSLGVGSSYEFATKHALSQWSLWAMAGISY